MVIEIAFGVQGKETSQALFIQESEWEITLSKVRKRIEEQELYVPEEYRFLTTNGNAISSPAEENITLKDATCNIKDDKKEIKSEESSSEENKEEVNKSSNPNSSLLPQLWITALKVNNSQEQQNDENGDESTNTNNESGETRRGNTSHCPYTMIRNAFSGPGGTINPKAFIKVLIPLALIIFFLLASMTLTMHIMVKCLIGVASNPAVGDIFKGFTDSGGQSEALSDLKVRLSQLEVEYKYEMIDLTNRIAEIEELYLKDLAIHKKELNAIKKHMGGGGERIGAAAFENDNEIIEDEGREAVEEGKKKYHHSKSKSKAGGDRSH